MLMLPPDCWISWMISDWMSSQISFGVAVTTLFVTHWLLPYDFGDGVSAAVRFGSFRKP